MKPLRIFISSVQNELELEVAAVAGLCVAASNRPKIVRQLDRIVRFHRDLLGLVKG